MTEPSLRVLLLSSSSGSQGGGELYLVHLAAGLTARGHSIETWLSSHPRMDELAERLAPYSPVFRVPYTNTYDRPGRSIAALCDRRTINRLAARVAASAVDVVHLNKQNSEDGLDLLAAAKLSRRPTVSTIHITRSMTSLGATAGKLRDRVASRMLRTSACRYVAVAPSCAEELGQYIGDASRIRCVPNGIPDDSPGDRKSTRAELGLTDRDFVLGTVARLEVQKNPLLLLRVLAGLPDQFRLLWVGDGRFRPEFERAAKAAGVADRVFVTGWNTDSRKLMAAFDVFVLPSDYEGLPLALLEAFAAGLPVVASAIDGNRDAIDDGESGLLLSTENALVWRDAILRLSDDEPLRGRLGSSARRRYEEEYSLSVMAEGTERVYREVIAAKQAVVG